jgi:hypothetical protein
VEFALFGLFVLYLTPWILAVAREHERQAVILAATLLLGWTGIGWLAILVWAARSDPRMHPPPRLEALEGGATLSHRAARSENIHAVGHGHRDSSAR